MNLLLALLATNTAPISVTVDGNGFLRFVAGTQIAYARSASLRVQGGVLASTDGRPLTPTIRVPADARSFRVEMDGTVQVRNERGDLRVGRLVLAIFGPNDRVANGASSFLSSARPRLANPGDPGVGVVRMVGTIGAAKAKVRIVVRSRNEVAGERTLLGDVAEIEAPAELRERLATVDLGASGSVGVEQVMGPFSVRSRLQSLGYTVAEFEIVMPPRATVTRLGGELGADRITQEAGALVRKQANLPDDVRFALATPLNAWRVPLANLRVEYQLGPRRSGGYEVKVIPYDGERMLGSRVVLLQPTNLLQVKEGDPVTLTLIKGAVSISARGTARTTAFLGEPITVITASGTTHRGVVARDGSVEVKL